MRKCEVQTKVNVKLIKQKECSTTNIRQFAPHKAESSAKIELSALQSKNQQLRKFGDVGCLTEVSFAVHEKETSVGNANKQWF
jgi:hypothetical protein